MDHITSDLDELGETLNRVRGWSDFQLTTARPLLREGKLSEKEIFLVNHYEDPRTKNLGEAFHDYCMFG